MKNPIKSIKNWSRQDKKQALVSVALTTFLLARAEMISLPKTPAAFLLFPIPILIMTPIVWFLLIVALDTLQSVKEWLERD